MAITITKVFAYPQIAGSSPSGEATRRVHYTISGISDGVTNLSNEIVFDTSWFTTVLGESVGRIAIRRLGWSEDGFTSLNLSFDRQPDVIIAQMAGVNYQEFPEYLADPGEGNDGTGNLLLSTVGATTGAVFNIEIDAKIKAIKAPSHIL